MKYKNKKGFTLVEIMIVVVIIGLLAAMAIPAFQKVRTNSIAKTVVNDGRQIGAAAQQYFMDEGVSQVSIDVATATGIVSGPLSEYVSQIGKKVAYDGGDIDTSTGPGDDSFSLSHALGAISFNNEGKATDANSDFEDNVDTIN
ncbi:MAG: prepilin-type N-terminal cleavage/methylation domain-containing protein [Verrucomicrobia bacterium]|jgi:type IV pilus assembly protein PilA|nr:prepilin-type N-terminal cleavage/methylation domain-containing protein [Verrucomicrobiota bacterium]